MSVTNARNETTGKVFCTTLANLLHSDEKDPKHTAVSNGPEGEVLGLLPSSAVSASTKGEGDVCLELHRPDLLSHHDKPTKEGSGIKVSECATCKSG